MSNFTTYKNARVHFIDSGAGEPVILLHGFLENNSMWNDLSSKLSATNRIIAIDLLGHGKTDCIGYIHTMEVMAEAVAKVLNDLKISSATIIGHSMGGYVALALLEKHPNLVGAICLMNSTAISDSIEKQKNRDRAIEAVKRDHKLFINLSITNLFSPDNRNSLKEIINQVKKEAQKTPIQSIVAALEGMKIRKDRLDLFNTSIIKKMVILGEKDGVLDYESHKNYYKNSNAKLVNLSGGHMSHIENNKEFTYNLMYFIENL